MADATPTRGFYIASKTKHGPRWRQLRAEGTPITSTWIDQSEPYQTLDWPALWTRCCEEVARSAALILYREPGELFVGAWVEVGVALACGVPIFAVGIEEENIAKCSGVTCLPSLGAALARAWGELSTPKWRVYDDAAVS